MNKLEQYTYQELNYSTYQNKLNQLLKNEQLIALGLKKTTLAKTTYGYDIDLLTIGHGSKELFLVGGTHGSEVIGTDFLLQLIETLPTLENFDKDSLKLQIISLQNPEGFDISTNTYTQLNNQSFQPKAYQYYLTYRTDSLITLSLNALNNFITTYYQQHITITNPDHFLTNLKSFFQTNPHWQRLATANVMPNINIFYHYLNQITHCHDELDLKIKLLTICDQTINQLDLNSIFDRFLLHFLTLFKNSLTTTNFWTPIPPEKITKLYQQTFSNSNFNHLQSIPLTTNIKNIYQHHNHPKGSQIIHDATGTGINLNANTPLNPGINAINQQQTIYGPNPKNNIQNYQPGPLGTPCLSSTAFSYSLENQVLKNLLQTSYLNDNYLATLLFHGTGGLIFYKPHAPLMKEETYQNFYHYNQELATIYHQYTNYTILEQSDTTGFGDYLRRTYPGVLLIELSKMGGNPLGPYGDKNNIYQVFNDNTQALNALFNYFTKTKTKRKKGKN